MPLTSLSLLTPFLTGADTKQILRNALVRIGGIDISNLAHTISWQDEADEIDVTPLGAEYRQTIPGQMQVTVQVGLFFDATVAVQLKAMTASTVLVELARDRPAPTGANPLYSADCLITGFRPLTGDVGGPAMSEVEFASTGPASVTE